MPHDHHDHPEHSHEGMSPSGHPYRADQDAPLTYWQRLEIAVRELMIERGETTPDEIAATVARMDARSPADGARVVARAWTDPEFKARLLADGSAATREMGLEVDAMKLLVVENDAATHNVIVCTLCSCYPRNLLGLPPDWYKQRAYRSRTVREPRKVLSEFGLTLPDDVTVRVHDSTADMRYIVLPVRPAGTEGWTEEQLAAIVTRDCMIGVAVPSVPGVISAIRALPEESRGILLFISGIFLFSLMDIIAKGLVQRYDPFQVVWARYASQTFWAFLLLSPRLRTLLRTRYIWMQILRSAFLFFATASFFTSLKFLLLAEVVAIFEVAPLMMTVLAYFILREKVGVRRWTGVGIGFIGAMIIIRPGGEVFTAVSILPVIGAACFAGYSIATRFLGREESPWTSFLYTALFGCVAASFIAPFYWTTPTLEDAAVMATFGIIGGVGHFALILAFTATSASILAPFNYIGLIFATFWGFTIFAEVPDFWTVIGALVIVCAGLYVWRRERMRAA